jgi:hypothetical protein
MNMSFIRLTYRGYNIKVCSIQNSHRKFAPFSAEIHGKTKKAAESLQPLINRKSIVNQVYIAPFTWIT